MSQNSLNYCNLNPQPSNTRDSFADLIIFAVLVALILVLFL